MQSLSPEQYIALDLELPTEAWQTNLPEEFIEELAPLFRLILWTGYLRGRADTKGELERGIQAQVSPAQLTLDELDH